MRWATAGGRGRSPACTEPARRRHVRRQDRPQAGDRHRLRAAGPRSTTTSAGCHPSRAPGFATGAAARGAHQGAAHAPCARLGAPGTVLGGVRALDVACGEGAVQLVELQRRRQAGRCRRRSSARLPAAAGTRLPAKGSRQPPPQSRRSTRPTKERMHLPNWGSVDLRGRSCAPAWPRARVVPQGR